MEERDDILDELESEEEPVLPHRQRSYRFLAYALGITLVLIGRLWWNNTMSSGEDILDQPTIRRLFALGIAGIWLFAGLGSLASIRAFKLGERGFEFVVVTITHVLMLVVSTGILASAFSFLVLGQ